MRVLSRWSRNAREGKRIQWIKKRKGSHLPASVRQSANQLYPIPLISAFNIHIRIYVEKKFPITASMREHVRNFDIQHLADG